MKIELQKEWYTVEDCEANPTKLYIFGDNLECKGTGGQAIIRNCKNSFGIPTKRLPSMTSDAFFSDRPDEFREVFYSLYELITTQLYWDAIVFPVDGLGTGLARMSTRSPRLFNWMCVTIETAFNIDKYPIWNYN